MKTKLTTLLTILFFSFSFVYAQTNGTADGTYNFGSLGSAGSAGTGFKKQGDKFKISNDYISDGLNGLYDASVKNTGDQSILVIKAEGGTVCKTFTLKDIAIYTYAGGVETNILYKTFTVSLFNASGGAIVTHAISSNVSIGKNAILKVKDIPFTSAWPVAGYTGVAEIRITFAALASKPEVLGFSNITVANVFGGTLPVQMTGFDVKKEDSAVKLSWKTTSEKENKGFSVLRRGEGTPFAKIKDMEGNGSTSIESSYSYIDKLPLAGINYYKLMQVDFNGNETELGEKAINFDFSGITVEISPNPTVGKVNVRFVGGKYENLILSNSEGKVLKKLSIVANEGNLNLDLTSSPRGIYFLKLIGKDGNETKKLIKE